MSIHLIAYYLGIFVVFASHVFSLLYPKQKLVSMEVHCYLNILAAVLIAYYFMWREKYIAF